MRAISGKKQIVILSGRLELVWRAQCVLNKNRDKQLNDFEFSAGKQATS